jgi:phosphatidylglycerol:prolipoprotein diacylglycerol transferase
MWLPPTILHLYGPFAIHTYGLMISLGIAAFMWCSFNDPLRKKYISEEVFHNTILIGIFSGIFGGRLLYALTDFDRSESLISLLTPWEPGFSLLGAVIMIPLMSGFYLWKTKAPVILFLDIAAIYAPLLQAIARIGCFGAGCCYGHQATTMHWWTVMYTHVEALAPLNIPLHPTQLYSAGLSFLLFIGLYFFSKKNYQQPGLTTGLYLIFEGFARFIVDFWRARSEYEVEHSLTFYQLQITYYQMIALGIMLFGIAWIYLMQLKTKKQGV